MELNSGTIGSYRSHEHARYIRQLGAVADAMLMAIAVISVASAMYVGGYVHGLISADSINAWADQVIAQ